MGADSEDVDEFEQTLRRLKPRCVSAFTRARVCAEMGNAEEGWWAARARMAVAAAAALLLIAGVGWRVVERIDAAPRQSLPSSGVSVQANGVWAPAETPLAFGTILVDERDEGPARIDGRWPARRFRYSFVDHAQWYDREQAVRYAVDEPREEVVLVAQQTY